MKQEDEATRQTDEQAIDNIVHRFFDLFTNTNNTKPDVQKIRDLFLADGILINNTNEVPEVYDLDSFIRPREEILTNGTLTNFIEKESSHTTEIHGNIAQRTSDYVKSGERNDIAFKGQGKKLMQFVKVNDKWFLSSVLWSDQ